jgi:hypothetical protein
MAQVTDLERMVPKAGVEPARLAARDFKSLDASSSMGEALNYMESGGTMQLDSGAQVGTNQGTGLKAVPQEAG